MGCIAHAGCDGSKYIAYLKEHYLLYDVETIQNAANRFSERIEDPTPLEFISAVSTDQIFVLDTDR